MRFLGHDAEILRMRKELAALKVTELRTPADVDAALGARKGAVLLVVNSVCWHAANRLRPGVEMALQYPKPPPYKYSVFAGEDAEATARARTYLTNQPLSSPSVALLKDGQVVFMLHRGDIEQLEDEEIAQKLGDAFDQYC